MKYLLFMAFFAIINYHATSQIDSTTVKTKDYYLQKSKSQKTTAWVFIGVGVAAAIAGTIVAVSLEEEDDLDEGFNKMATGGGLLLGGGISCLVSIPFFISAGKNERKAMSISTGFQQIPMPANRLTVKQPAVSIRIPLGR